MLNNAGTKKTMGREAFLYRNVKLLDCSITNQSYFGSGKVYFCLTGIYMNDPSTPTPGLDDRFVATPAIARGKLLG